MSFLKKPYPLYTDEGYTYANMVNLGISFLVFFILFLFKPVLFFEGTISYTFRNSLYFSLITLAVSLFYTNIVPRVFKKQFVSKKWTVGKEVIYISCLIISIGILNYIVGKLLFQPHSQFDVLALFKAVISTIVVAIIPVVFVILVLFNKRNTTNKARSKTINDQITTKKKTSEKQITLTGEGKFELLQIIPNNIYLIESGGNYCDILFTIDGKQEKRTFRTTLKSMSEQLRTVDYIIKTHRSFLVNVNHINRINGNAQGYQLYINEIDDYVPVSRGHIKAFESFVEHHNK